MDGATPPAAPQEQAVPVSRRIPERIARRLRIPAIAAPMLRVSGPELTAATCAAGAIGAFPAANARSVEELDAWFAQIRDDLAAAEDRSGRAAAPLCPNLIVRHPRYAEDLACAARNGCELVITSVGSPKDAVGPIHDAGGLVFADVASVRHVERAAEAGADGLILLTAGAGGQTGWANPFAFARAARAIFDGPIVLAGGISDGRSLLAALALDCDLAYMGTRFIATAESRADPAYKTMLTRSSLDDVLLTRAFTGLQTNMLRPSIEAAGLDPERLDEQMDEARARDAFGAKAEPGAPRRWKDIWSAGHSVSGIADVPTAAELVERLAAEIAEAR
tara:strand:+ start:250 stop:1254 length:1005 start_codon:yes stop_codon:yes gene_type:complete